MNVLKNKKTEVYITDENSAVRDASVFKNKYFKEYPIGLLKEVIKSHQSKIDLLNEMISIHPDKDKEANLPF